MGWSSVLRRDRWRAVAAYWVVQWLVFHTALLIIIPRPSDPLVDRLREFLSPELPLATVPIALILAACQAVLLLPWTPAAAVHHTPAMVWWSRVVCGVAVGGVLAVAVVAAGLPLEEAGVDMPSESLWRAGTVAVGLMGAVGTVVWLATTSPGGVPAWIRALVAGTFGAMGAGALAGGVCALVYEVPRGEVADSDHHVVVATVLAAVVVSWAVWTPLLLAFLRRPGGESRLARVARVVFGGSLVHAGALVPLDIMVRRRDSCYCGEASFWALSATLALGLFALGPAVFLVPFASRRARLRKGFCPVCGYDLASLPEPRVCPECGPSGSAGGRYTAGP